MGIKLMHIAGAAFFLAVCVAEGQPGGFGRLPQSAAGQWAHFLGPDYNGVPRVDRFDPKGIRPVWSREVGTGCSSVTIADGKVYTMGNRGDRDIVSCLDVKTGAEVWTFAYDCGLMPQSYEGGPGCTPTVSGGRVYTVSRKGQVHCLDARDGRKIWMASLEKWTPKGAWWGFNNSPVVWEDRVFLNASEKGVALNRNTGAVIWSGATGAPAYASILPLPRGNAVLDRPALVLLTCGSINIVDPGTGASLLGAAPDWAKRVSNNNAVTPAVFGGSLIFMHARHGLSRISRAGNTWTEDWLCPELMYNEWDWFTFNRQVIHNGHLFALAGRGTRTSDRMMCIDLATGKVKWQKPMPFGSLILAAGRLLMVTQEGEIAWGALDGIEYRETFRKKLLEPRIWAHPVLHDGRLYTRSNGGTLTCLRLE
jgi:outer membrane protein assembly factor BamB